MLLERNALIASSKNVIIDTQFYVIEVSQCYEMLQFTTKIILHVFAIYTVSVRIILSLSTNVCLTWEATHEEITFKCKVSNLNFRVLFYNPVQKEEGHCSSPFPQPACYPSDNNNEISQDNQTNTTTLIINRKIDSSFNGPWTCYHGTNLHKAVVNVTILEKVTIHSILKNNDCREAFVYWTYGGMMIGVGSLLMFRGSLLMFSALPFLNKIKAIYYEKTKNCCKRRGVILTCTFMPPILLMCLILMPMVIGFQKTNCKDKMYFIVIGVVMVWILLCIALSKLNSLRTKDMSRKPELRDAATSCTSYHHFYSTEVTDDSEDETTIRMLTRQTGDFSLREIAYQQ